MTNRTTLSLLMCLLLTMVFSSSAECDYVRVTGSVVNVRQGPGTSQPVLFQAREGEEFILIREDGLWYKVALPDGQEAYVFGRLAEILPGDYPSVSGGEGTDSLQTTPESGGGSLLLNSLGFLALFLLAGLAVWKRREMGRKAASTLREWSGYRRDKPFRYDSRPPEKDRWEI